jgi:hypothetical protein
LLPHACFLAVDVFSSWALRETVAVLLLFYARSQHQQQQPGSHWQIHHGIPTEGSVRLLLVEDRKSTTTATCYNLTMAHVDSNTFSFFFVRHPQLSDDRFEPPLYDLAHVTGEFSEHNDSMTFVFHS